MQFENNTYLYLLMIIPVIIVLFYISIIHRKKAVIKLGEAKLVNQLMTRYSVRRKTWKLVVLLLALSFLIVGLSNLRSGSKKEIAKGESSEIIICFDVSNSMMAEDVKPSRLTLGKITAEQIISEIAGNKIGMIVFAGNSYVQMPLSNDARAAMMYLNTFRTDMVPTQGTAIGDAIQTAMTEFEEGGDQANRGKAIIFITDGESHDANAMEMAEQAEDEGIQIITIGVGTKNGGPIPVKRGDVMQDYKRDKDGNIVLSRLNENMLKQIAEESGGFYINASSGRLVTKRVGDAVDQLEKTDSGTFEYAEYANHFQIFLAIGLTLMSIEFFMSDKKPRWVEKLNLFQSNKKEIQ